MTRLEVSRGTFKATCEPGAFWEISTSKGIRNGVLRGSKKSNYKKYFFEQRYVALFAGDGKVQLSTRKVDIYIY